MGDCFEGAEATGRGIEVRYYGAEPFLSDFVGEVIVVFYGYYEVLEVWKAVEHLQGVGISLKVWRAHTYHPSPKPWLFC